MPKGLWEYDILFEWNGMGPEEDYARGMGWVP